MTISAPFLYFCSVGQICASVSFEGRRSRQREGKEEAWRDVETQLGRERTGALGENGGC